MGLRIGAVAAGMVVSATGQAAFAGSDPGVVKVRDHYTTPAPEIVADRICPPEEGAIGGCAIVADNTHGNDRSDTLRGTSIDEFCVNAYADDTLTYSGTELFTGSLKGCGTGTVVMEAHGRISALDPATGARTNTGWWTVVPTTGTGGLSSLNSGGGTIRSTVGADLSDDGYHTGVAGC